MAEKVVHDITVGGGVALPLVAALAILPCVIIIVAVCVHRSNKKRRSDSCSRRQGTSGRMRAPDRAKPESADNGSSGSRLRRDIQTSESGRKNEQTSIEQKLLLAEDIRKTRGQLALLEQSDEDKQLFLRYARVLQKLIGGEHSITNDNNLLESLRTVISNNRFADCLTDSGFRLSPRAITKEQPKMERYELQDISVETLKSQLQEDCRYLQVLQNALDCRKILEQSGKYCCELLKAIETDNAAECRRVIRSLNDIIKQNRCFAMFADDEAICGDPNKCLWFEEAGSGESEIPALFVAKGEPVQYSLAAQCTGTVKKR